MLDIEQSLNLLWYLEV